MRVYEQKISYVLITKKFERTQDDCSHINTIYPVYTDNDNYSHRMCYDCGLVDPIPDGMD